MENEWSDLPYWIEPHYLCSWIPCSECFMSALEVC